MRVVLTGIFAAIVVSGCNTSKPTDRGSYDVAKHYDVACADRGGYGEYAVVRSHRLDDIEPAFRRWYALNRRGPERCLYLFMFSSKLSQAVFQHEMFGAPATYTDRERTDAHPGLYYTYDPLKHEEFWRSPDGRPHKGGPGQL